MVMDADCGETEQADISWTAGFNGGKSQTFTVEYSIDKQTYQPFPDTVNGMGTGETHHFTVTGLTGGTLYFFRLVSTNAIGSIISYEVLNCTVKCEYMKCNPIKLFALLQYITT